MAVGRCLDLYASTTKHAETYVRPFKARIRIHVILKASKGAKYPILDPHPPDERSEARGVDAECRWDRQAGCSR